jgi:hypothetical protein
MEAGTSMWLAVIGIVALVMVIVGVLSAIGVRALRQFVRSVWPHS